MGKIEMWYVIDNVGGKVYLCLGLSKKIIFDEYVVMIVDNIICDVLVDYVV